jgi:hypothetical protein
MTDEVVGIERVRRCLSKLFAVAARSCRVGEELERAENP